MSSKDVADEFGFGNIRFMQIVAEVPWTGSVKRHSVVKNGDFFHCFRCQLLHKL